MAKTVRFHRCGGPDVLRVEDLEVGDPGPGEVRIRVGAIGLNRAEVLIRSGLYAAVNLPARLGYEAAGVIEAVASGVGGFAPGDRIATLAGAPPGRYGAYGERVLFPADRLVKVTAGQSLVEAAACWMQYFTAYPLVGEAGVGEEDRVVITAASSSVGLAAIQIVNAEGGVPIAVTRGRAKAKALREQGAAHVLVSEEEDVAARVREITDGHGARIVFDAVAGSAMETLVSCLMPGGIFILYGMLDGLPNDVPWGRIIGCNQTLRGYSADAVTAEREAKEPVIDYVNSGLASGALCPVVDRIFDLSEIADAHRYLESNAQLGKIIVTTATADE